MARATNVLMVLAVLAVGGILLQIFLSKRESKWPGLILPVICLLYPLILILNVAAAGNAGSVIATLVMSGFMGSIPAAVLLAIYFACLSGRTKKQEMEKMNLHDL